MNPKNKAVWDKIKEGGLRKEDGDRVYIVDGRERSGKSLFTLQQAAYIDETILDDDGKILLPRVCFSVEEVLSAIRNSKSSKEHTKVIIFDEAFRGLSSKSALSKINKSLVQAMMEMGQNNLVLFIVSPSVFLLEPYVAILRSNALFHIVKLLNNKRIFKAYNYKKKAPLYQIGLKKGWSYKVRTIHKDYFFNKYPGGDAFEKRYRKKKYDSLKDNVQEGKSENKFKVHRDMLIYFVLKEMNISQKILADKLKLYNIPLAKTEIGNIHLKYGPMYGDMSSFKSQIEILKHRGKDKVTEFLENLEKNGV